VRNVNRLLKSLPKKLIDGLARSITVVKSAVGDLPDGMSLARVTDDCTNLYLMDWHCQSVS